MREVSWLELVMPMAMAMAVLVISVSCRGDSNVLDPTLLLQANFRMYKYSTLIILYAYTITVHSFCIKQLKEVSSIIRYYSEII